MERKEKVTSIIFGLSVSILAVLQLIFHPAAAIISLELKPAETAPMELYDFEDKLHPFNLVCKPPHCLPLVYLSSFM